MSLVEYCEHCGEELNSNNLSEICDNCGYDPSIQWICPMCNDIKDHHDLKYQVVDEFQYPLEICEDCYRLNVNCDDD